MPNPPGNDPTVIIGSNTCLQPNLRIQCNTTSSTVVSWTRNGVSIAGGEFLSVTEGGVYECSTDDGCGRTISASSEVFCKLTCITNVSSMVISYNLMYNYRVM